MMKKILMAGVLVSVLVLAGGAIGIAYAQTPAPPTPSTPGTGVYGPGMMRGGYGRGLMSTAWTGNFGPLHEYMVNAFATSLGLTPEELQTRLASGETMATIAQSLELSLEDFRNLMIEARTNAINQAVADGVLTQEFANWMLQRMDQMQYQGGGFGFGHCGGGFGSGGRGAGWRWTSQP